MFASNFSNFCIYDYDKYLRDDNNTYDYRVLVVWQTTRNLTVYEARQFGLDVTEGGVEYSKDEIILDLNAGQLSFEVVGAESYFGEYHNSDHKKMLLAKSICN